MSTVLADYALLRSSLAPKLILPLNDGSGTTAVDAATSPQNATYVGSPTLSGDASTYGNPSGTKCMTLAQAGTAICRAPTAGKLAHLVDGTLSHTTLIVVRSTDATNPNPFNYPVALGFANNFGTYDNMVQMCLNGKADGNPNGSFACYRWNSVANGSTGAEFNHGGSLFDGNTHTVAFVYSTAASGTLKIYVDGVLGTNATGVNTKAPTLQTYFGIGTMVANNGTTLDRTTANVEMSDFQYFETELTAAQIAGWHSRAINGENSVADGARRLMSIHMVDSSYGYAGAPSAHASITGGTVLAPPVLSLHTLDNSTLDPTYGLTFDTNTTALANSAADALIAAFNANKPCVLTCNKLLCQSCTMNAVSQGFDSQPTPASLLTGLKARQFIVTDEAARLAPWITAFLARLTATGNSALRFNAVWSNTEELPLADLVYNQPPGQYRTDGIAFRTNALADPVIAARITALIADGAATDEYALDYLIHEAAHAAAQALLDTALGSVPIGMYYVGRNAVSMYQFRNGDGTANSAGICADTVDIGSWAYQSNSIAGEGALLIEDLAHQGEVLQMPLLDIRYAADATQKSRLATRMNACRDRGVNDLPIFGNQMAAGADADLTNATAILAAAQGARMSVPVIQSSSRALFGGNITVNYDVAVNQRSSSTSDFGYRDGGGNVGETVSATPVSGDGTTALVYDFSTLSGTPVALPTVNDAISIAISWVEAVSGGQDSDAVANFPCPISGIVSVVFDEGALTLTLTLVDAANVDDPSQLFFKTASGVKYHTTSATSGSGTAVITFAVETIDSAVDPDPGTMVLFGSYVLIRVSDSQPGIDIYNYPITEIPAGGGWLPDGDNGRTHRLGRMNRGRST